MSSAAERVGWVREGWRALDLGEPDTALEFLDAEIEIHSAPSVGNPGTFHGHDGWRSWTGQWFDAWESFDQEVLTIEAVGDRCAIAKVHQVARGRAAGVEIERDVVYVYELRDGKVIYMGLFADRDAALEAAATREADG